MKYVVGSHYDDVIDIIEMQTRNPKTKKLRLYLKRYSLFQLLPILYHFAGFLLHNELKQNYHLNQILIYP